MTKYLYTLNVARFILSSQRLHSIMAGANGRADRLISWHTEMGGGEREREPALHLFPFFLSTPPGTHSYGMVQPISIADSLPLVSPLWRCPPRHSDAVNNLNPVELTVLLTIIHMSEANIDFEKNYVVRVLKLSCFHSFRKLSGHCKV